MSHQGSTVFVFVSTLRFSNTPYNLKLIDYYLIIIVSKLFRFYCSLLEQFPWKVYFKMSLAMTGILNKFTECLLFQIVTENIHNVTITSHFKPSITNKVHALQCVVK